MDAADPLTAVLGPKRNAKPRAKGVIDIIKAEPTSEQRIRALGVLVVKRDPADAERIHPLLREHVLAHYPQRLRG